MCWQRLNSRRNSVSLGLFSKHTLGFVSMSLALAIFLIRVLNCDLFGHDVLVVHAGDGRIRGLEIAVGDETVTFRRGCDFIARNLWRIHQWSESTECVVQSLLVYTWIKIANEQLCANLDILLLICRCLVHTYPASVKGNIVENFRSIVGFSFCVELDEAETLVLPIDTIDWHIHITYTAGVEHQLVKDARCDALMEITDVYGGFFVLLPVY